MSSHWSIKINRKTFLILQFSTTESLCQRRTVSQQTYTSRLVEADRHLQSGTSKVQRKRFRLKSNKKTCKIFKLGVKCIHWSREDQGSSLFSNFGCFCVLLFQRGTRNLFGFLILPFVRHGTFWKLFNGEFSLGTGKASGAWLLTSC